MTGHTSARRRARRRMALFAALALTLGLLPATTALAQAPVTDFPGERGSIVVRVGDGLVPTARWRGENRYDTARLIATDETPFGVPFEATTAVIARGDQFPDALAGAYVAGLTGSAILLTPSGTLAQETREALEYLGITDVVLLGGTDAISTDVEATLADEFDDDGVERIAGGSRYETAALAALAGEGADTAIVASGENFPDALVAGPLSYSDGIPMLLTAQGELPAVTSDALEDLGVERVLLAGGERAVAPAVADAITDLGIVVERLAGAERSGTAAAFARIAVEDYGYTSDHFQLATGDAFPDALAVAAHAGAEQAPVLITSALGDLDDELAAYIDETAGCDYLGLHVAGGENALPYAVEDAAREALTLGPCFVTLAQSTDTNFIGQEHTVSVTVTGNGGAPMGNVEVTITASPETSTATPEPAVQTVTTDDRGAAMAIFNSATPGSVTVTACVEDPDGGERCAAPLTKTYLPLPVAASGLLAPRDVEFGPDGALYVAEQGAGGDDCVNPDPANPALEVCVGATGAVTRIDASGQQPAITGLPSVTVFGGATGPEDIDGVDADGNTYVVTGLGVEGSAREGIPDPAGDLGTLLRVAPDGGYEVLADLAAYEESVNPDGAPPPEEGPADSNPYSVLLDEEEGVAVVADAGGNTLLDVDLDTGEIATLAVFPEGDGPQAQYVPTVVELGPDGAYYAGGLRGEVYRVERGGEPEEFVAADGSSILDLEFGADDGLYLLTNRFGESEEELPEAAVSRVAEDGSRTVEAGAGLVFPLGLAVADNGDFFVSHCWFGVIPGLCPTGGEVVRIPNPPAPEVLAEGLANPRGLAAADDGSVYVTEQGTGGEECRELPQPGDPDAPPGTVCFGDTGAITRVGDGGRDQVVTGLPSYSDGFVVTGPSDVTLDGDTFYASIGMGAPPDVFDQLVGEVGQDFGWLARADGDGVSFVADVAEHEQAEDPDGQGPDSNPFAALALDDGRVVVADAGGNDLVAVDPDTGETETMAVFPDVMVDTPGGPIPRQSVPTSVVLGPDGALYVGELAGEGPGDARIWRVPVEGGEPEIYADGFQFVLDLAFGDDGSLYVLQAVDGDFAGDFPPPGTVVRHAPDGTRSRVLGGLLLPLGMTVGQDGDLYVSNCGISLLCPTGGQVLRVANPQSLPSGTAMMASTPVVGDFRLAREALDGLLGL